MNYQPLAFIGAGNMARAIIQGLLAEGYPPALLRATTSSTTSAAAAEEALGISVSSDNLTAVSGAEVVVLAVKPQMLAQVCQPLKGALGNKLVISVAAGVETTTLEHWLGEELALVRIMPNTPCQIGTGASGLFANARVSTEQRQFTAQLAAATGTFVWVEEEQLMHAITAVSGSGPAYFFHFFAAMMAAAVELGLSPEQARELTLQTASGAAALAAASDEHVTELKQRVMSPGGTTEQAINVFEQAQLTDIVSRAMRAAAARSESLAQALRPRP